MKNITFLYNIHKVKNSVLTPFTFKLADYAENIRVKGSEKWLVSLRNRSEKWLVSLGNRITKTDYPFLRSVTEIH